MDKFSVVMVIDENGDYAVGRDRESAWDTYCEEIGFDDESPAAIRWVDLTVKATPPKPVNAEITIPDDANAVEVSR